MVESESNTDSEEKKDTLCELPALPKDKGKAVSTGDPDIISDVEVITLKAKGIVIDEAKASQSPVKSVYHLRSGYKGTGVDAAASKSGTKPEDSRKRKGKEKKTETDSEEACKRIKKGRNNDDDPDKDGAGAGGRITRSSARKRKADMDLDAVFSL